MPTFEGQCKTHSCTNNGIVYDYLLRSYKDPDPPCPSCGGSVERMFSSPAVIWAKELGQYCGQNVEGHYGYGTSETGERERVWITNRKQQKDFCKKYGYYDPNDLPSQPTADVSDINSTRNTRGEKGGWI